MIGAFIPINGEGIRRWPGTRRPRLHFATALLLAAMAVPVAAVGPNKALNDSGITTYGNATDNSLTSAPADFPGQDARYGRDGAAAAGKLSKVGAGSKGFDFTKIANDGTVLPAGAALGMSASDWACTYDNVTGLMWEVKVNNTSHLRDQNWTYTWYDSNSATNGGGVGSTAGWNCKTAGRCDTEKFAQDVNTVGMCGHGDWRMPTARELESLVDFGRANPAIDVDWFPNTPASSFWSASAEASYFIYAWGVYFSEGYAQSALKANPFRVRLVRAGQ